MPQTTTTTSTALPAYLQPHLISVLSQAARKSREPFSPYGGQRVAEFQPLQQEAFGLGQTFPEIGQEEFAQAGELARGALQPPTAAGLEPFMNPFDELVTQQVIRELGRQQDIQQSEIGSQAARAGAFGGSRQGVIEAESRRNFNQLVSDVLSQRGAANFEQAQNRFLQQQGIGLQGADLLATLGSGQQQLGSNAINTMLGLGALQQTREQAGLDIGFSEFLREQQYPYENIGFYSDVIRGVPSGQTGITTQTTPDPNTLSQIAGLGLTGIGLYNTFFGG